MPKGANYIRLATLHLGYGVCKLPHISHRAYAENSLIVKKCHKFVKVKGRCGHKGRFYMNIKKVFHFCEIKQLWCWCKVCVKVADIDWDQDPHMSSWHNKNLTTSHYDIFLHILPSPNCTAHGFMGWYPCWLDVYSHFDCIWMSKVVLIQGRNHPSTRNGLLGKLGVKCDAIVKKNHQPLECHDEDPSVSKSDQFTCDLLVFLD